MMLSCLHVGKCSSCVGGSICIKVQTFLEMSVLKEDRMGLQIYFERIPFGYKHYLPKNIEFGLIGCFWSVFYQDSWNANFMMRTLSRGIIIL